MTRYDYLELREKALAPDATQEDIKALAEWCIQNWQFWNGEFYDISADGEPSGSLGLYPIYDEKEDEGIIGWEIR